MSEIFPGIPPMGQGGGHGSPSLSQKCWTRWFQLQQIGNDPSPVCPPRGVERVDGEEIKNTVEMRDDRLSEHRHARLGLRRSDASDLCPLTGSLASCQILQASHPHKCHEWARQGWWQILRQSRWMGHLGCRGWIREIKGNNRINSGLQWVDRHGYRLKTYIAVVTGGRGIKVFML